MSDFRFALNPVARMLALGAATFALMHAPAAQATEVSVERVWQFAHQANLAGQKSEIVAYDDRTDTLWVAGVIGVDVLSRISGQPVGRIDVINGAVNSVAIHDGLAALAIEAPDRTQPGKVLFYDTRTLQQLGQPVTVGPLPDMLTFTPNGKQVLVANEGTPNPRVPAPTQPSDCPNDPEGSVSIIDVGSRTVETLPIKPAIPGYADLRLFPAPDPLPPIPPLPPTQPAFYCSYGPEPEYIAIDKTGKFAYVGLQEANGIAVLNLKSRSFEKIYTLGMKDFNDDGNEIDPSDRFPRRNFVEFVNVSVKGLYQPDTITSYEHKGRTYLVMANEGDARDNGSADGEDERRAFVESTPPLPEQEQYVDNNTLLARLTLSNVDSVKGGPLVKFGAHSFSIRDTDGNIVFDSGSTLDREANRPRPPFNPLGIYDDTRSDNKGVEPEGVALLEIEGRVLAFIGLERTLKSAFAVFDITDPREVEYIDMVVSEGDRSVEGLKAFKVGSRYYVATANEVSDTTSLFEVRLSKGQGPKR